MAKDAALTVPGIQRTASLVQEIKRQSQPRRWPWQEKTVRDLLNERRADLAEEALARSAKLVAAANEQRDTLLSELQRQTNPRRWPWQQKTVYDRVIDRRERLTSAALERANALSSAATSRRDLLLTEARRQSKPSRWPWQEATLRDKFDDQREQLASAATERAALLAGVAATKRKSLVSEARRQAQPSRWPWQQKTAYDKLTERRDQLASSITGSLPVIQDSAAQATERIRRGALSTADTVQQQLAVAPQRFSGAAESLFDTADTAALRVRESAGQAAASVKSAAMVPVDAVRSGVEAGQNAVTDTVKAGKRSVRRGVRLGRVFLWALVIGGILGILFAPRIGEETRRNLLALWNKVMELVDSSSSSL